MVLEAVPEKNLNDPIPRSDRSGLASIIPTDILSAPVDNCLEKMLIWAQAKYGNEEFVTAKEEFFWKSGKVFHDDPFYDERMSYFLDYFLLQRPIPSDPRMQTPFIVYQQANQSTQEPTQNTEVNETLAGFIHSLFQVLKVQENKLTIENLFTGQRHEISARTLENFKALNRKDIFQGFLYLFGDKLYLSHGIIFHPAKTIRLIRKQVRRLRKAEGFEAERELAKFSLKHLKYLRHVHVDPRRIYTGGEN